MMTDVVIPARNEETTIRGVVSAFRSHPSIGRIIVVIDPQTGDDTEPNAILGGADIVFRGKEHGKGQCVKAGLLHVTSKRIIFCDSDLSGFASQHVKILVEGMGLTIGVPDFPRRNTYPHILPRLYSAWPWVSGERSLPTRIARNLDLHGYLMEVQINAACNQTGVTAYHKRLIGVRSPLIMNARRLEEMEKDREWGIANGILPENSSRIGRSGPLTVRQLLDRNGTQR